MFDGDPIVGMRSFSYRYPGAERAALSDVSLTLEPGSFTLLAGESASGKSTLLRALCGLVPHFHGGDVTGELEVAGMDVRSNGPGELAAVCGTVFQDPEAQIVMSGVRAELSLPLEQRGTSAAAVARGVEEAALALGVADLLDRAVETLSGGELQRVALAAALAGRPQLVVLDEPTAQLDPVAGDEFAWLLRRVNEEWGTTVVVAEHRLERLLGAADRVVALADGSVVCDAPPRDFLAWAARLQPVLASPAGRLFSLAGLAPLPTSVKEARAGVRRAGLPATRPAGETSGRPSRRFTLRRSQPNEALRLRGVWHELVDGPALLRGVDLRVRPGELIALMGRNGAGKSTLLRQLKGLTEPTRGRITRAGEVALLLQNPGNYLIHERVDDEVDAAGAAAAGLDGREAQDPRDLSGGERQRLALEIVLAGGEAAVVCLDEPTRGMDRRHMAALAARLRSLSATGAAVIVATHDSEFVAEFAERVVLMGKGEVIADGDPRDLLAGGWHFSTEVARILDGAGGALTPEEGAALLGPQPEAERIPALASLTNGGRGAAVETSSMVNPEVDQ